MPSAYDVLIKKLTFFFQRLIGATLACAFWMTQGDLRLLTPQHWRIALQTAFFSSTILLLISFSKLSWLQEGFLRRFTTTAIVVAIVDYLVHPSHFGGTFGEGLVTGISASALVSLIGSLMSAFS